MAQLQRLGFAESDARRALAATQDFGAAGTPKLDTDWQYGAHTTPWGQRAVAAALDWLCVHLPEASLPAKYAAGGYTFCIKAVGPSAAMGTCDPVLC